MSKNLNAKLRQTVTATIAMVMAATALPFQAMAIATYKPEQKPHQHDFKLKQQELLAFIMLGQCKVEELATAISEADAKIKLSINKDNYTDPQVGDFMKKVLGAESQFESHMLTTIVGEAESEVGTFSVVDALDNLSGKLTKFNTVLAKQYKAVYDAKNLGELQLVPFEQLYMAWNNFQSTFSTVAAIISNLDQHEFTVGATGQHAQKATATA